MVSGNKVYIYIYACECLYIYTYIWKRLYIKTNMISNQESKKYRQIKINVHSVASLCSIITVEPKFSKICCCYWRFTARTFGSLLYDSVC